MRTVVCRGVVTAAVTPAGVRTTAARASAFARRGPIARPVRRVSTPHRLLKRPARGRNSAATTALPTEVDVFNFENVVGVASPCCPPHPKPWWQF